MLFRNAKMKRETEFHRNAKMRRETDQNLRKVTFCDGKRGKILRKVISRGRNGEKCLGKRLRAAGRRLKVSEIGFVRWEKERTAYALRTFSNENDFAYPYK